MAQRDLDELSVDECFAMLGAAHVGRLVYLDDGWPVAIPVNFAVAGREVVLRVAGGSKQAAIPDQSFCGTSAAPQP
jgi:nitroimidazol reductase NimA-like FMN-containing flavoprotein (pyridoxamine 5'-phosphate oxidase superfamily)